MPKRKNLHFVIPDPVIEVVVNSSKMDAPHARRPCIQCGSANSGLRAQKQESLGELFVQGLGSKGTILLPPKRCALDLRVGSPGDPNAHGLLSRDGVQAS